jgi:hypothetical protein
LDLFRDIIFPEIHRLVGPGGKYEGYIPVMQGDNAGPHEDATYKDWFTGYCEEQGWYWEPQAPQMPHMNNLDLSVHVQDAQQSFEAVLEQDGAS